MESLFCIRRRKSRCSYDPFYWFAICVKRLHLISKFRIALYVSPVILIVLTTCDSRYLTKNVENCSIVPLADNTSLTRGFGLQTRCEVDFGKLGLAPWVAPLSSRSVAILSLII